MHSAARATLDVGDAMRFFFVRCPCCSRGFCVLMSVLCVCVKPLATRPVRARARVCECGARVQVMCAFFLPVPNTHTQTNTLTHADTRLHTRLDCMRAGFACLRLYMPNITRYALALTRVCVCCCMGGFSMAFQSLRVRARAHSVAVDDDDDDDVKLNVYYAISRQRSRSLACVCVYGASPVVSYMNFFFS